MIMKITNKDDIFYSHMGRFFGSRIVQSETKDRVYDDNGKIWYLYLDETNKSCAFISVLDNVIKNIYSNNVSFLKELLKEVKNDFHIKTSIVTNLYKDVYIDCGLDVIDNNTYKHFVTIRGDDNNV